jgi:hypothetical protein
MLSADSLYDSRKRTVPLKSGLNISIAEDMEAVADDDIAAEGVLPRRLEGLYKEGASNLDPPGFYEENNSNYNDIDDDMDDDNDSYFETIDDIDGILDGSINVSSIPEEAQDNDSNTEESNDEDDPNAMELTVDELVEEENRQQQVIEQQAAEKERSRQEFTIALTTEGKGSKGTS